MSILELHFSKSETGRIISFSELLRLNELMNGMY